MGMGKGSIVAGVDASSGRAGGTYRRGSGERGAGSDDGSDQIRSARTENEGRGGSDVASCCFDATNGHACTHGILGKSPERFHDVPSVELNHLRVRFALRLQLDNPSQLKPFRSI